MKTIFRFPGDRDYAYAQVETSEGNVFDVERELRDVSDGFLNTVGDVLHRGCAMVAVAPVSNQVLNERTSQQPQNGSYAPQEAQGYSGAGQGGYAPQNSSQGSTGAYQGQQYQQNTPPGQNPPTCQYHQRPAEYKPGGTSRRTGKPYDAFWACAAGDNNCTRASNFPRA